MKVPPVKQRHVHREALRAAFDQGVTFFDTALAYGSGYRVEHSLISRKRFVVVVGRVRGANERIDLGADPGIRVGLGARAGRSARGITKRGRKAASMSLRVGHCKGNRPNNKGQAFRISSLNYHCLSPRLGLVCGHVPVSFGSHRPRLRRTRPTMALPS